MDWNSNVQAMQQARDTGDFATADKYVSSFLAELKQLKKDGPPPSMAAAVNDMVNYMSKLHDGLKNGSLKPITADDIDSFNNGVHTLHDQAQTVCR